jgi:hypothetical protein
MNFCPYFPYFLIRLDDAGCRRFPLKGVSTFEVREHWCSSNRNLPMGVQKNFYLYFLHCLIYVKSGAGYVH